MSEAAALSKKEQVFKICDELFQKKEKVTEAQVLALTRFSSTTVHRYVSEWKKTSALRLEAPQIPSAFLESLNKLFSNIRSDVEAEFNVKQEAWEQELEGLNDRIESLELTRREDQEEILAFRQQTAEQERSISNLETALAEAKAERDRFAGKLAQREEELAAMRQAHEDEIKKERERAEAEIERLDRLYQAAEKRMVESMDKERTRVETNLKEVTLALETLKEKHETLAQEQKRSEIELSAKATHIENLDDRLDECKSTNGTLANANEELREDNGQLRLEVERLKVELANKQYETPADTSPTS